ncbi:5'-3' exoribonuclease 1 isoform X1 [Cherax quadricarinatus]|nr:5'-3' exoribonuclease 1-like isoform X1 [Cherax quadricarinatus]
MGVPKFYRWTSERYPCLSEVVKEYQIPEFDNLYLDMNGIIHICSHPNDNDPHFRITDEKIFKDIFHYIEVLFRLIQPREVFFMAVDGVAPRAKMNQQRGRRFRSANEAVESERKAKERGEVLPTEERFDSNCITPGTEFMARLDAQLQYFVTSKISQDRLWQNCKVIYSGHQTPGEGEHKIMEFIRYTKSQPEYNPNTRHCLYGLDADLIMLGLTSHEPHFSLLREEVRFGGKKDGNRRTPTAEETTFHLLHLSLMREYINYEFFELHNALSFGYNLENIIDDWVLMGFLVGNDFIPHLPHLHINREGLPILYRTYKDVLPTLDGYLNDGGKLHLGRFEKFMAKLSEFDVEQFHEHNADLKYFHNKSLKDGNAFKVNKGKGNKELEAFNFEDEDEGAFGALEGLDEEETLCKTYEKLGYEPDPMFDDDEDLESDSEDAIFNTEFRQHKRAYYMSKMHFRCVNSDVLHEQATSYVRGIQWILNYYYNGICSWSWFYPYHYSPYISDIKDFADMEMKFEMGKPFLPYEQLLAVLPPLSRKLLSHAYQGLMTNEDSPLKEFYPVSFKTDLNGKQQDWEAVVLIPFIDEKRLLEAMKPCNEHLTTEERSRNTHGPMFIYRYSPDNLGEYKSPKYFPPVGINHASVSLVRREEWELLPEKIYKGLCKGVKQNVYFAGFPSLRHIDHKFHIAKEGVKVFQQNSRGENFILDITETKDKPDLKDLAHLLLGKAVFVSWPHLLEAKVEAVSDNQERYSLLGGTVQRQIVEGRMKEEFSSSKNHIISHYHDRWGVEIGNTEILVYAAPMTGRKYVPTSSGRMSLEKEWSKIVQAYAHQVVVRDIVAHDPGYKQHLTPQEYFPKRTKVFMLGQPHYGCMGEVIEIDPNHKGRIRVAMTVTSEPNFDVVKQKQSLLQDRYMGGYFAAQKVGISSHLLARITGTVFLVPPSGPNNPMADVEMKNKLNIGLNLKSNKRNEEVCGYSRKALDPYEKPSWLYSDQVVESLLEYQKNFPEIFEHLSSNDGQKDIFYQDQVFGVNYKERVAQLTDWLKNANFAKAERQPCGTQSLGEAIVSRLVEEIDKVSTIRARIVKMQVRPHLLYKPNPLQGSSPPDHTVTYKMFDRVINVREGFSVPIGAKGTVMGIQPADKEADILYDILFDEAFPGGLTLRGPTSAQRCYRLHWAAMINISHGSRLPTGTNNHRVGSGSSCHQVPEDAHTSKAQRTRKLNNYDSPQPPDPNQLPSPSGLRMNCHTGNHYPGVANGDITGMKSQSPRHNEDKMILLKSANEVQFIVHGTYYASWNKILQQGLGKASGRNLIPCYSSIPRDMTGSRAYQLYIFLDVRKAMSDGMKFFRVGERHILCTGDKNGLISPMYFSKVVDSESNTVIYPSRPATGTEALPGKSLGSQWQKGHGQAPPGHGRGRAMSSKEPQGMQLYQNIWSQVQRLDAENVDLRPMQSQMLSQLLNISGETKCASTHQTKGASLPPHSTSSQESTPSRVEVSVQDIFKGAVGISQLHISHNPQSKPIGEQCEVNVISALNADPHVYPLTQHSARNQKPGSPSKSAFVPTQVIRNQTPRKPRFGDLDNHNGKQDLSTNLSYSQQQEQLLDENHCQQQYQHQIYQQHNSSQQTYQEYSSPNNPQYQQHNSTQHPQYQQQSQQNNKLEGTTKKPKRQARNRLAVKFDQPLGKN